MWETSEDGTEKRIDVVDGGDHLVAFTILVRVEGIAVQPRGMWFSPEAVDVAMLLLQQAQQLCREMRTAAGVA